MGQQNMRYEVSIKATGWMDAASREDAVGESFAHISDLLDPGFKCDVELLNEEANLPEHDERD